ncbi:MAG: GNAT family N-acetyltransferase [Nakamurella sp.]
MYRRDPSSVRSILESPPSWFGDPDAIDNYEHDAVSNALQSVLAVDFEKTVGVALVRRHLPEAAELHLIAVAPDVRGRGLGRGTRRTHRSRPDRRPVPRTFRPHSWTVVRQRAIRRDAKVLPEEGVLRL